MSAAVFPLMLTESAECSTGLRVTRTFSTGPVYFDFSDWLRDRAWRAWADSRKRFASAMGEDEDMRLGSTGLGRLRKFHDVEAQDPLPYQVARAEQERRLGK